MDIETKVDNNYRIFKLAKDELNYTFVAEGAATQPNAPTDDHSPHRTKEMKYFVEDLTKDHMKYLAEKNCSARNFVCSYISFSYELPYESAVMDSEIWHTEKLSDKEKEQFEQCMVDSHKKFWKR